MKVGDLLIYRDERFNKHRFYEVEAVCLGVVGQESLIRVKCLNETPGQDTYGVYHETTWVPEPLLRAIPLYTRCEMCYKNGVCKNQTSEAE